jgi:hypothetical protein
VAEGYRETPVSEPAPDHLRGPATLDQHCHVAGNSFHDPPVLGSVAVLVVHAAYAAVAVVQYSVHRRTTVAEGGDRRAEGAPQIVRRGTRQLQLLADVAHGGVEAADRAAVVGDEDEPSVRCLVDRVENVANLLGEPDAVGLGVLGAGPSNAFLGLTRHLPPAVF